MDETAGCLTTAKLQALIDSASHCDIRSRRDLARVLVESGEKISVHGVEAWFRHVDSNYNFKKESLVSGANSYPIPKRRWRPLLELFSLHPDYLKKRDSEFRDWCFARHTPDSQIQSQRLFGRSAELQRAKSLIVDAGDGSRCIAVIGDPGMGKTTFLSAIPSQLPNDYVVLRTLCSHTLRVPLNPLFGLLKEDQQLSVDWSADTRKRFGNCAHVLAHIGEGNIGEGNIGEGNAVGLKLRNAIVEFATASPLVLIFDDFHWCDETTVKIVAELNNYSQLLGKTNLTILLGCRANLQSDPEARTIIDQARQIHLEPFSRVQIQTFLEQESTTGDIEPELTDSIATVTRGNPLYLRQILFYLDRPGRVGVLGKTSNLLPGLESLFGKKFSFLDLSSQRLAQFLSAFDKDIDIADLQYLFSEYSTEMIIECLENIERTGLVKYCNDKVSFVHSLAKQTVYETLSITRRAYIHHSISQKLSEVASTNTEDALEVAEHLLRGKEIASRCEVARVCCEAAQLSRRIEAWDKAVEFSTAALNAYDGANLTNTQLYELRALLGDSYHQIGQPQRAIDSLAKAAEGFCKQQNIVLEVKALASIARIRANFRLSEPPEHAYAIEHLTARVAALPQEEFATAAWAFDTIALHWFYQKRNDKAMTHVENGLRVLEQRPPIREASLLHLSAGLIHLSEDQPLSALEHFVQGETIASAVPDLPSMVRNLERLCMAQYALGRFSELSLSIDRVNLLRNQSIFTGEESLAVAAHASALVASGKHEEALSVAQHGLDVAARTGYRWAVRNLFLTKLAALVEMQDFRRARYLLAKLSDGSEGHWMTLQSHLIDLLIRKRQGGSITKSAVKELHQQYESSRNSFVHAALITIGYDVLPTLVNSAALVDQLLSNKVRYIPGWPFSVKAVSRLLQ